MEKIKKQVIIDYDEYQKTLQQLEDLKKIAGEIYFEDNDLEELEATKCIIKAQNEKWKWWF